MNQVLENVQGLMPDVLDNALPSTTGKSIQLPFKKWMIIGFIKKLVKYYIDKLVHWLRMQKFNLELDNDIKKPKIIEKGTFGEDGWSISIGDVEDGDT